MFISYFVVALTTNTIVFSRSLSTINLCWNVSVTGFLKIPNHEPKLWKRNRLVSHLILCFSQCMITDIVVYCCYIYSCIFFFCLINSCWYSSSFLTGSVFSGLGRFSKMMFSISSISFFGIFFSEFTLTFVSFSCGVGD